MKHDVKNIMFDLGGVIMDLRRERSVEAFSHLGLKDAGTILGEYSQAAMFGALERGDITPAQWRDELRRVIGRDVSDPALDGAFCEFLDGIPVHRLRELQQLRRTHGVYLLSNTNPVMWDTGIARQFAKDGLSREDYFDGITTSFEARSLKPSPAIFEYAARTMGIEPGHTVFLDDSQANCLAARSLGWHALHVAPGREFMDVLKDNGYV